MADRPGEPQSIAELVRAFSEYHHAAESMSEPSADYDRWLHNTAVSHGVLLRALALTAPREPDREPVTRWHVEAAVERLDDIIASLRTTGENPTGLTEVVGLLRDGLDGKAAGLTARGYAPPFYGTLIEPDREPVTAAAELGRALRAARGGSTQRAVGNDVGLDFTYISKIENGADTPSRSTVIRLATYYRVDPEPLLVLLDRLNPTYMRGRTDGLREAAADTEGRTRWHHSPDAPPEHFCEDCDRLAEGRTLDVERLYHAMLLLDEVDPGLFNIVAISEPDTRPVAARLADLYSTLSRLALAAPTPRIPEDGA